MARGKREPGSKTWISHISDALASEHALRSTMRFYGVPSESVFVNWPPAMLDLSNPNRVKGDEKKPDPTPGSTSSKASTTPPEEKTKPSSEMETEIQVAWNDRQPSKSTSYTDAFNNTSVWAISPRFSNARVVYVTAPGIPEPAMYDSSKKAGNAGYKWGYALNPASPNADYVGMLARNLAELAYMCVWPNASFTVNASQLLAVTVDHYGTKPITNLMVKAADGGTGLAPFMSAILSVIGAINKDARGPMEDFERAICRDLAYSDFNGKDFTPSTSTQRAAAAYIAAFST